MNMNKTRFFTVMLGTLLSATLLSVAQTIGQASNSPAAPAASAASVSEQLTELMRAVNDAERATLKANGTNEDRLWKVYASLNATTIPKIIDLAAQEAESPTAFISCEWVVTNRQVDAGARKLVPYGLKAVELLRDHGGATNPAVAPVCWAIGHNWDYRHQPSQEFFRRCSRRIPTATRAGMQRTPSPA